MLSTPGLLWRAAEADVKAAGKWDSLEQYLGRVKAASRLFLDSNELHDREAIMTTFYELLHEKGQLVLALGGKSLGKTFLLTKLEQRLRSEAPEKIKLQAEAFQKAAEATKGLHAPDAAEPLSKAAQMLQRSADAIQPRRVVRYNARHDGADLVDGLLGAFQTDPGFFKKYAAVLARLAVDSAATAAKAGGQEAIAQGVHAVGARLADAMNVPPKPVLKAVVEAFVVSCEQEGSFPCLIVDEANAALVADDAEQKSRTIAALRLFTEYTKELRRLNVILAASEYSEPYRLSALPFKSDHFTDTVLVPEVPPKEMRALLMGRWGMGSNLATAFMAVWGGHIWAAVKGIERLAAAKETFRAVENPIAFSKDAVRGAVACVEAENLEGMRGFLTRLAANGFSPFRKETDARVKLISERNVGGVVQQDTVAPGIPRDVWASTAEDAIVVPTNQALRMLLAKRLRAAGA